MDSVSSLVIGNEGEVGSAIQNILRCDGRDKYPSDRIKPLSKEYDVLHVCIPWSEKFIEIVESYRIQYNPNHIIIHSTVPIGTSRKCNAVHSPVRGIHPHLEKSIRTFVKYFSGPGAKFCAELFYLEGMECKVITDQENTEALKLWDTTIYGLNILIEKEIYKFCKENNLSFDLIYKSANFTYNKGYKELGYPQFTKYDLEHQDGEIGGHCVVQNAELLDSPLAKLLCKPMKN